MKGLFRRLKLRLFRLYFYIGSSFHVRHWRGKGIHSPFMYSIVRKVFMKHNITGKSDDLYRILRQAKVSRHNSVLLQNLYAHCRFDSYYVVKSRSVLPLDKLSSGRNLCILTSTCDIQAVYEASDIMKNCDSALIVMAPHRNKASRRVVNEIWDEYHCVSVDRRVMALYFFDEKLQKQHYRI